MKDKFQSKAVPRGTRTIWRYLSALFLLFTLGIGQMWAADPVENVGTYSTQVISADGTSSTWTFILPSSQVSVPAAGATDNDIVFAPSSGSNMKFTSSNQFSWKGQSDGYIPVPNGSAGTISMTLKSTSDSRYLQLYVGGSAAADSKRLWSKYNATPTSDGKKGPQSFSFTADDITTEGGKTYLHFRDNNTELKIATFTVTLTTGTYLTPSCSTEISTQPSGATLAVGDANPELSIVATNVASYAWKESSNGTSYDGASSLGSSASFTPSVNDAVQTKYYYCEVTSSCDGAAVSKSDIVTVNVVGAISYYTVTLNPAGGTIVDATGWTLNAGNYEKEVAEGTVLTLPTFTKTNRTFKTWRKAGPTDVTSPITVTADVTLTAVWNATVENVIYSWEGAEGGATEVGGTAHSSTDGGSTFDDAQINVSQSGYYCIQLNGGNGYADKIVEITLSGEEKVKAGDKIRYTGFYNNSGTKNAAPKMRASDGTAIFSGSNLPNITTSEPRTDTHVVPSGINTATVQLTRHQTQSSSFLTKLQIIREVQVEEGDLLTVTFNTNGGSSISPVMVASGQAVAKPADPTKAHNRFAGWQLSGSAYDFSSAVNSNITLDAVWTQLYTVTYAKGEESATGDAPTQDELAAGEKFEVAANTFTYDGHDFSTWNDGANNFDPGMEYTMGSANVTLTAQWVTAATKYAITKGSHANGDFTIDPAEQAEGGIVTLAATPDEDYVFSAWEAYKTGEPETTVPVSDNKITMPAYAVTVNAIFVADPRQKVLYLTTASTENDKLYAALKDDYNLKVQAPGSQNLTDYALVVLHESLGGSAAASGILHDVATAAVPVLNTKSYFYNSGRWGWGTPNNGKSAQKVATISDAYCNADGHPIFAGIDVTGKTVTVLTNDATGNTMQPVGSFEEGKEGYVIATTPNASSGTGAAIQEMTPAQRGAASGKYLLISVSNAALNNLSADGQRLFKNAAAYLIDGSVHWTPVLAPSGAEITASPSAAYATGSAIALTASAANVSATTTYTWYKGDTWAEAEAAGAIQAAEIAENDGNVYSKTAELGDAGTYWCVIVKDGGACEATASLEISVVDASYNISFVSAHGTAPTATTGVGYLLPELAESGWVHQGWTANVDVIVDAEPVTASTLIANGKTAGFSADVVFTAVWAQEFQVTFNGNGHGTPIAPQDVLDGDKVNRPADPSEIGFDFGGWYKEAACTNAWDFANDVVIEDTELFAKWTAFTGCTLLYPATGGSALSVGDNVDVQTGSKGGSIQVVGMKEAGSIAYNERGLLMGGGSADIISVTLNNDMDIDTKISVTLDAKSGSRPRGLYLLNGAGGSVKGGTLLGWNTPGDAVTEGEIETFSYTVEDADGLAGTNVFRLKRQNSTYIKCIKVESCGAAITYHNLTSAVVPAGKGEVALGASSVREGHTTTATFSNIDPLYEFVSWSVSGEGASIDDPSANPVNVTMGTEDAVVTLNLQLIPEKFTVNYYDGETPMGTEEVELNANPTAAGIETAKRHFTFQGWSETDGGSVVALNTITSDVVATIDLFAVYAPVACPVSGTIFSVEIDDTKIPASTVKVAKNGGTLDVADYVIISDGKAMFINDETSDKDAISNSGQFRLVATKAVLKVELDCALQENDIIRIDNNQKWVVSTSKTKTGTYQALTSAQQEFAVTADWAGVDDLYFLYDGSSLSFTQIEVYRPALLTVSFDLNGHEGSAPADIEDVLEGSKITAPTAPTDEDYAFIGWYKESSCENEWNFAVDVVSTNTTLYAKWLDKSDATLKSLKYGSNEIALEDGVFEYNIALAAATVAVPALTAVTNNPAATAVVTDDDAFDEDGKATSTVVVTPEKEGAATRTYTVNFTKLAALPQVGVSASTLWNFSQAVAGKTSLENVADVVLANLPGITNDETFNSQALEGTFNKLPGGYFQGSKLMFTVAEEGLLTIEFSGTNDKARHLQVCSGDGETVIADWNYNNGTHQTKSIEIPAGKITLKAFEGTTPNNARIYKMEYLSLAHSRTSGYNAGDLGTVCLEDATVIDGANLYELQGVEGHGYLAFDQITTGELEAGKPYLFEVTNPSKISFYKQVGAAHSDIEIETNGMIGTFTGTTLTQGANNYCYFSGRHIWRVNDFTVDIPVPAYRCYVDYDVLLATPAPSTPAPGRRRVILGVNGEQVATGVENVQGDDLQTTKVLINGELYILRGEKMYDATGRMVK